MHCRSRSVEEKDLKRRRVKEPANKRLEEAAVSNNPASERGQVRGRMSPEAGSVASSLRKVLWYL